MKYTQKEINKILENHVKWLNNEGNGRANLSHVDLRNINLRGADLRFADLSDTNLSGVDLSGANLRGANLSGSNLSNTNLSGVDLSGVNLYYTNLSGANLSDANLRFANLSHADFRGADLRFADLRGADYGSIHCPEYGSFIGWKKLANGRVAKLEITEDALRSSATSRKCRASKAKVLAIYRREKEFKTGASNRDKNFIYNVGEIVEVTDFDTDRWNECASGIHFFITKQEAEYH